MRITEALAERTASDNQPLLNKGASYWYGFCGDKIGLCVCEFVCVCVCARVNILDMHVCCCSTVCLCVSVCACEEERWDGWVSSAY